MCSSFMGTTMERLVTQGLISSELTCWHFKSKLLTWWFSTIFKKKTYVTVLKILFTLKSSAKIPINRKLRDPSHYKEAHHVISLHQPRINCSQCLQSKYYKYLRLLFSSFVSYVCEPAYVPATLGTEDPSLAIGHKCVFLTDTLLRFLLSSLSLPVFLVQSSFKVPYLFLKCICYF